MLFHKLYAMSNP